jgi:hypothetical protein
VCLASCEFATRTGLGIDAQREALSRFATAEGYELVWVFVEVETGKGADALDRRPQLAAALVRRRSLLSSPEPLRVRVSPGA